MKFVKIDEPDSTTLKWIHDAKELSGRFWLQIWHLIARLFLGFFMTQTSVNGFVTATMILKILYHIPSIIIFHFRLLKRGSMFILSDKQFAHLLISGGFPDTSSNKSVISVLGE